MPRWARFVSCSFTGLLFSLAAFMLTAFWREGRPGFWLSVLDFLATPSFWSLMLLFAIMTGAALLTARALVKLCGLPAGVAGGVAGCVVAGAYVLFLMASHAPDWGGLAAAARRSWIDSALFLLPFTLGGSLTAWLWERLD